MENTSLRMPFPNTGKFAVEESDRYGDWRRTGTAPRTLEEVREAFGGVGEAKAKGSGRRVVLLDERGLALAVVASNNERFWVDLPNPYVEHYEGAELRYGNGPKERPTIGSRVRVRQGLGEGTVVGYYVTPGSDTRHGPSTYWWMGYIVKLAAPPEWFVRQNEDRLWAGIASPIPAEVERIEKT